MDTTSLVREQLTLLKRYRVLEDARLKKKCERMLTAMYQDPRCSDKELSKLLIFDICTIPLTRLDEEIIQVERTLRAAHFRNQPATEQTITNDHVVQAKSYPLDQLAKPNSAGFVSCPFHEEKSPSCKIFKDNRWHCFGCQARGDAIDWVQKVHDLEFIDAVRFILAT